MTTYLGKRCSFCLPRVPFVNCRQFMYLVISLFGFEGRIWDLIVSVPDHCLSFYIGSTPCIVTLFVLIKVMTHAKIRHTSFNLLCIQVFLSLNCYFPIHNKFISTRRRGYKYGSSFSLFLSSLNFFAITFYF